MGEMASPKCRACGHEWERELLGGTMTVVIYRCTRCAKARGVNVTMLSDAGLPDAPWDLPAAKVDKLLGQCECGGHFRSDAPLRCPACNSTDVDPYGGPGDRIMVD